MANAAALLSGISARPQLGRLLPHGRRRAGARAVSGQGRLHPHPARQGRVRCRRREPDHAAGGGRPRLSGHIACDAASASELVVPILDGERLIGVLDLDSPAPGRFDEKDQAGCEALVRMLAPRL
ncbi:GAF domain-containing protein [Sphingomonas sp. MMS24-JH45]